jgi:hypothetical protein
MGYKALVTLDLLEAATKEREEFYEVLESENWIKISNLDTAWKINFIDGGTRIGAINTIKNDLEKAKQKSKTKRVDYAIQIDVNDVIIDNL